MKVFYRCDGESCLQWLTIFYTLTVSVWNHLEIESLDPSESEVPSIWFTVSDVVSGTQHSYLVLKILVILHTCVSKFLKCLFQSVNAQQHWNTNCGNITHFLE